MHPASQFRESLPWIPRLGISYLLAVDGLGAGVHEKVLLVLEGRAAGEALGKKAAPVDAAIIGIIDHVDVDGDI